MTRASTVIGSSSPTRSEAAFVQRAQHLGLRLQAHVADFVEEQRAAVGLLELAFLVGGRAGKRALAMAEQFALDQVFGNGGAVDLDEHGVLAQALRVDGARRQFLAGAGFAVDQHAAVGGRHQRNLLAQRLHGNAVAHDHAARLELLLEFQVLAAQPLGFDGVLQHDQRALDGERLFQEVEGAELGGAHRGLDVAVAGDHDDFGMVFALDQLLQRLQAVDAGQPDVEQDHVERTCGAGVSRHSSPLSASSVL